TISSNLYPSHDAPSYLTGNIVNAGLLGFLIVLVIILKNALKS
ncbi:3480_t:CDS:2, partial [Acaulospora morrowiae]